MDPNYPNLALNVKSEENENNKSSTPAILTSTEKAPTDSDGHRVNDAPENANQNSVDLNSSKSTEIDDQSLRNTDNQLVLYDPAAVTAGPIVPFTNQVESQSSLPRSSSRQSSRTLQSIAAFAVQCAECFKWRIVPTEEKYEEIRAHILERLFYCKTAQEWHREVSCNDPTDLSQDGSRTWAIDRPGIVQPPRGWRRHVRIRAEGGTKFADVFYEAPSGKRFRSMVEVEKHLQENPIYVQQGVTISQFSFQVPKPLKDDYVRKRTPRSAHDRRGSAPGPHEPVEVSPISWIGPDGNRNLHLGGVGLSTPNAEVAGAEPGSEPKRRKTESDAVAGQSSQL